MSKSEHDSDSEASTVRADVMPEEILADLNTLKGELGKAMEQAHAGAADTGEGSTEEAEQHGKYQAFREAVEGIEEIQRTYSKLELSASPEEIVDGLTIAVVETGEQRTVSTERLVDDGVLVVRRPEAVQHPDEDEYLVLSPGALYERLYVEGSYYVPEYSPSWEVNEALDQLAGDSR